MAEHWVAHTRGGDRGMVEPARARWLWERLAEALPDALSCVLLLAHLHLTAPPNRSDPLRYALRGYRKKFGVQLDLLEPERANSAPILFRQIRYGLFNPCRDGLVDDPWSWRWSTLRDLGGACGTIWTPLPRVARMIEMAPEQALRRLTAVGDFRAPPLESPSLIVASVDAVVAAVSSALRWSEAEVRGHPRGRRLVIQTCYAIGQPHARRLAASLGCSLRTVERARAQRDEALGSVLRCLADLRLRG